MLCQESKLVYFCGKNESIMTSQKAKKRHTFQNVRHLGSATLKLNHCFQKVRIASKLTQKNMTIQEMSKN